MNSEDGICIDEFHVSDQQAVRRLILAGLAEHWGRLDPAKNPDLDDIAASYAGAILLVARQGDRIVGSGALVPRSATTAEIVRMSVARAWRRKGVGRRILTQLCEQAVLRGFQRLILETTGTWSEAIQFYLDFGFEMTHELDGDVYFKLDVNDFRNRSGAAG